MPDPITPAGPPQTLSEALVALQGRLPKVERDATGQYGSYATLSAITDALTPIMTELGLAWSCCPTLDGDRMVLAYELLHVSGGSKTGNYPLPAAGMPQQLGSAITYARRYALCAVTGLAPVEDDDDAQRAQNTPAAPVRKDNPEERPGSSTSAQHRMIGILFARLSIRDREERLSASRSILGLDTLGSSKDLSYMQAQQLAGELERMAAEERREAAGEED